MLPKRDNYAIMLDQARRLFLTYDQSAILAKSPVTFDSESIFLPVLDRTARISRSTGSVTWLPDTPATPHEALTLYDYLCDARPERTLSGQWQAMANFGSQIHSGLLETTSPLERAIDHDPDAFRSACIQLGGVPFPRGDIGFRLPLFPDLPVVAQFWHSDEEFPPQLRWFWDKNSLSYLRYETLFYALGLIRSRLQSLMAIPGTPE